MKTRQDIS